MSLDSGEFTVYEYCLLSNIIKRNSDWDLVCDKISKELFHDEFCAKVFEIMVAKLNAGQSCFMGELQKELGVKTSELMKFIEPGVSLFSSSCLSYLLFRQQQERLNSLRNIPDNLSLDDQIAYASKVLDDLDLSGDIEVESLRNFSGDVLKNLEDVYAGKADISVIPTGFYDVDKKFFGFKKQELIIIAGRPAMGKTSFAMNCAFNIAKTGKKVLIISLEMGKKELYERALSSVCEFNVSHKQNDFSKIVDSSRYLDTFPLKICDRAGMTVENIQALAKKMKRRNEVDIVFIDYLQIITPPKKQTSRNEEIGEITRKLKNLAKDLDVPVILLSQLSRDVEKRDNKRPIMADLRDSGSIEQDADIVSFLYREQYYVEQNRRVNKSSSFDDDLDRVKNKATFIVAKNRRGITGDVELFWNGEITTFGNLSRNEEVA